MCDANKVRGELSGSWPPPAACAHVRRTHPYRECSLQLVDDAALLIHVLQLLTALIAAWPLMSTALSPLLCTLFLLYATTPAGSVVEVTCQAALTQCTQTFMATLSTSDDAKRAAEAQSSSSNNNNSSSKDYSTTETANASVSATEMSDAAVMNTQLHAISYFRDLCRMAAGKTPQWLRVPMYMMELAAMSVRDTTHTSDSNMNHAHFDNNSNVYDSYITSNNNNHNNNDDDDDHVSAAVLTSAVSQTSHSIGRASLHGTSSDEAPAPPWHVIHVLSSPSQLPPPRPSHSCPPPYTR